MTYLCPLMVVWVVFQVFWSANTFCAYTIIFLMLYLKENILRTIILWASDLAKCGPSISFQRKEPPNFRYSSRLSSAAFSID
jgi:hypothetical protein